MNDGLNIHFECKRNLFPTSKNHAEVIHCKLIHSTNSIFIHIKNDAAQHCLYEDPL